MTRKLDWKWIGIGVLIMIALNIVVNLLLTVVLGSAIQGATDVDDVTLTGGQATLIAIVNFLVFVIGGFIVGLKSTGQTILEPGISAAVAVLIALLISGNFTVPNILVGGILPFLAGVLGGWLGERRQGTA